MSEVQVGLLMLAFFGLGLFIGTVATKEYYHGQLTPRVRKILEYARTLLGNYYSAHLTSSLTDMEIKEVLTLCKTELDKVLEG